MWIFPAKIPPWLIFQPRHWWHRRLLGQFCDGSLIGLLGATLSNMKDDQPETPPDKTLQHHLVLTPREKCKVSARDQGNTKRLWLLVLRFRILYLCLLCAQYRWCHYIDQLHQARKIRSKRFKKDLSSRLKSSKLGKFKARAPNQAPVVMFHGCICTSTLSKTWCCLLLGWQGFHKTVELYNLSNVRYPAKNR